jgi:hypothetical protein
MTAQTHSTRAINTGILCLAILLEFAGFANCDSEPNKPADKFLSAKPVVNQSQPQYVLCGHITDTKTGQPVTDATVSVEHIYKAETDSNGYYRIDTIRNDRDYRIAVDSNGYTGITSYGAMPIVNFHKDKEVVKDFKLDKACIIEVQVIDEANWPIEGAELSVSSVTEEYPSKIRDIKRRTTKNGIATLGGIPPDKTAYLIIAVYGNYIQEKLAKDGAIRSHLQWDYAPGKLEVMLNDTNVTESGLIVLKKGADVYGKALYENGVPASDLRLRAFPDWGKYGAVSENFPIDANGNFTLRHITPGIYRLDAYIHREVGLFIRWDVLTTTLPLADNEPLKLTIPQKSPQVLASIRGKLVFKGEKIPNYVQIDAYPPNGSEPTSHSTTWQNYRGDACDVNFVIDRLEPGKYRITVTSSDTERKDIEDVNAPCENLEITLKPAEKPILKGTVIDSQTNQPIKNFKARAKKNKILRGQYNAQPDKWIDFNDNEGSFNIESAGPGIYQIQIAAEGFAWTWSKDVNTDQNVPVVVKLGEGGSIKGSVVDEKDNPVNGAKVLALSKAGGLKIYGPAYTEDPFTSEEGAVETIDGKFELKGLPAGKESIKVLHPGYIYSIINDIEVKEGGTTKGIEVVLNKGATVQGYVFDDRGRPQPKVTLYFQDIYGGSEKSGRLAEVTTDKNGYYNVECLPEKLLTVGRQNVRESMGVTDQTIVPANGKISRIDLGGQPNVTGQIMVDGRPLPNRKIELSSLLKTFRCNTMTEDDGTFAFGGIPCGKWTIYYDNSEKSNNWYPNWIPVEEFELSGPNINLGIIPTKGFSTVSISIEHDKETTGWNIIKAHLTNYDTLWSKRTIGIDLPTDENKPYEVKHVLPGEYHLYLVRKDYSLLKYPIKVSEGSTTTSIHLPKCTAGISGRITGKYPAGQTIRSKDKTFECSLVPDKNGNYNLENLPAGHYIVGSYLPTVNTPLLEFELMEDEQKVIDIDIPQTPQSSKGMLHLMVLDENGAVLPGAKAWLEGGTGTVEPSEEIVGFFFLAEPQKYMLQVKFTGYKEFTKQVQIESIDLQKTQRSSGPVFVRLEKQ